MSNKKRILITEDDSALRRALVDTFTAEGYDVSEADNGQTGLEVAVRVHPDVILLDLVMPVMDGLAMLNLLRADEWGKDVPVLILTNSSQGDDIEKALALGVHDFLVKTDWQLKDVVARVKEKMKTS